MTSHSHYFDDCDHRSSLLETILHTIYRLSKSRSLTKNQLDTICDFLMCFTRSVIQRKRERIDGILFYFSLLKPAMMTPLLRKLVHDVPVLTEQTIVPLRVCCSKMIFSYVKHTWIVDVDTMVRTMQSILHSGSNRRRETIDDDLISEDL
jgi:hypothetical protein